MRTLPLAACLLTLAGAVGCQGPPPAPEGPAASSARHVALRLRPGQDLRQELLRAADELGLSAVGVVTCVGSLSEVTLRYANQPEPTHLEGHFEIVSLVGTLEPGGGHLHLALSDGEGQTVGGHLLDGSKVYTTAEVVLVQLDDLRFAREPDPQTTYRELVLQPR